MSSLCCYLACAETSCSISLRVFQTYLPRQIDSGFPGTSRRKSNTKRLSMYVYSVEPRSPDRGLIPIFQQQDGQMLVDCN